MKRPVSGPACFTVLDALGGLFRLERRQPTLRGSVPLRVAQACVPLLEGNAFGFQVTLGERWPLTRGRLGWSLSLPADEERRLRERYALARRRLVAAGHLHPGSPADRRLDESLFVAPPGRLGRSPRLRLWTGLLVRPDPGLVLRVLPVANRRSHSFRVGEAWIPAGEGPDGGPLWPLFVELELAREAAAARGLTVTGELACLAPFPAAVEVVTRPLAACPEVGRRHADFYDPSYFQKKGAAPTRRYRRQIDTGKEAPAPAAVAGPCEVIVAGPTDFSVVPAAASGAPPHVLYRNLLDFSFRYDGATVALDYDRELLQRHGQPLWHGFRHLYGADFVAGHEGALLYLSRYFTTHPPGEPHFFVKPWAFTRTPPGWSSLVDGCPGDGYDVLRGVVATDQFHATPAVFAIHRADAEIRVAAGAPLVRVLPVPRWLLASGFRSAPLSEALLSLP